MTEAAVGADGMDVVRMMVVYFCRNAMYPYLGGTGGDLLGVCRG